MKEMDLEKYCLKNDRFDEDSLEEKVEAVIRESGHIREVLSKRVPEMRDKAFETLKKVLK